VSRAYEEFYGSEAHRTCTRCGHVTGSHGGPETGPPSPPRSGPGVNPGPPPMPGARS
jgi:hypothetical protein